MTGHWAQVPQDPCNEIVPSLWQGGSYFGPQLTPWAPAGQFDVVVNMAGAHGVTAASHPGVMVHNYVISDDRLGPAEMALVMDAVNQVTRLMHKGCKVLVRCQAGLNRSGLVVALSLLDMDYGQPQEIIDLIRAKRSPDALCNEWFVKYILGYGEANSEA